MPDHAQVNLVAAVGPGGTIGPADGLPMMVDEAMDFQDWFLDLTHGGIIVLGHNSYHWLLGRGFSGFGPGWMLAVWGRQDPQEFIEALMELGQPIFISGGLKTYETFIPYVKQFFIRRVAMHPPHENYMPPLFRRTQ